MRGRIVVLVAFVLAAGAAIAVAATRGSRPAERHAARPHPRLWIVARSVPPNSAHPKPKPRPKPKVKPPTADSAPPAASRCPKPAPPPVERQITHRQWLHGVTITEYYPAPERWFVGRRIPVPGLSGRHAADWLYSARGVAMEGDGVDLHGRHAHIAALGSTGWVNAAGRPTLPVCLGKWTDGFPAWLIGGWRNRAGAVTFPLASGGWSNGPGVRTLPYGGVTFAPGSSLPLRYYHTIAVDPRLIPLGSRVFIPAYRRW